MFSEIKQINFEDVLKYRKIAIKEQVSFHNNNNCYWFGIFNSQQLISFYCLMINKNSARFKSNYTLKDYRRHGCLARFIEHAKNICKDKNINTMTLFCTESSINSHKKAGMEVLRYNDRNKIYYGRYVLNAEEL